MAFVPKAHLDYAFLNDEVLEVNEGNGQEEGVAMTMTMMVMVETLCDSVWSYATNGKGHASDPWLAKKIQQDLATVGVGATRIVIKSDTEAAIVELRREVAKSRGDVPTGFDDSRVGDSNSNGKVERAVREVKGLIRCFRSCLQDKLQEVIPLNAPIMPWIVRHAGYVITRCKVHECGRTSLHRMKGQKTNRPMIPFGEVVLFKLPKTKRRLGDLEDRFEKGVWLGLTVQSGENIVCSGGVVYRTGSIMRRAPDQRWSPDLVKAIKGTPAEPNPGSGSSNVPTYAKRDEQTSGERYEAPPEAPVPQIRQVRIYKNDVIEHGGTDNCKACQAIALNRPGHSTGGHAHSGECRLRFEALFREAGSVRMAKADSRMDEATYRASEAAAEPTAAEEEEKMDEDDAAAAAPAADNDEVPVRAPLLQRGTMPGGRVEGGREPPQRGTRPGGVADPAMLPSPALPGQPMQKFQSPSSPRESPGKKRSASQDLEDGSHDQGRPASSSGIGSRSSATTSTTTKRAPPAEDPEDERPHAFRCTDELSACPAFDADIPIMKLAKSILRQPDVVGSRSVMSHPGPVIPEREITAAERQWNDIGSGVFAKTFSGVDRLITTTRGGPPIDDIHRRTTWSLSTGKMLDDCIVDDTPDHILNRKMGQVDNIRVELTMKNAIKMFEKAGADVSEIYSRPRIAQAAAEHEQGGEQLRPGWSLDLTTLDPSTGEAWDLSKVEVQNRVMKLVQTTKPLFLIGSPPCTAFSPLQRLSRHKRSPAVVKEELRAGRVHLDFCMKLYAIQVEQGRFFIHEHPHDAESWQEGSVVKMAAKEEVNIVVVDMCAYGMRVDTGPVQGPARKRTKIMSNSYEVLKRIEAKCPNSSPDASKHHVHVPLESGRAKRCQVYPRAFSRQVCAGIAAEKRLREMGLSSLPILEMDDLSLEIDKGVNAMVELHELGIVQAFDDQSGEKLDPLLVRKARMEEMAYFKSMNVYDKVPLSKCMQATGRRPIAVRWVDINKGDSANPNYRSRLVAKEFRGNDDRPEWFAATPPSECLKLMLHMMASREGSKLLYADVSRAYFYAPAVRPVYVNLPEEDRGPEDAGLCGELRVSMYGTRDAAMNWAVEYGETLKKAGFKQGKHSACLFFNETTGVAIMVHGDDFVAVGAPEHLATTEAALAQKYKIKTETLGTDAGDVSEVKILNKIVRATATGLELEADPRHAELIVRELGVENCRTSKVPGSKAVSERGSSRVVKPGQSYEDEGVDGMSSEGETVEDEEGGDE